MRQRQEGGSPGLRDDPKRPKVAARSPQLGPRGTPDGGPAAQQPLAHQGNPQASPWHLQGLTGFSVSAWAFAAACGKSALSQRAHCLVLTLVHS